MTPFLLFAHLVVKTAVCTVPVYGSTKQMNMFVLVPVVTQVKTVTQQKIIAVQIPVCTEEHAKVQHIGHHAAVLMDI